MVLLGDAGSTSTSSSTTHTPTALLPPRSRVVRIKVISMGDMGTGKSCLIKRSVTVDLLCVCAKLHACAAQRSAYVLLSPSHLTLLTAEAPSAVCSPCPASQSPNNNNRYCEDKFISKYIPTIGIDYGVKPVQFGGLASSPAAAAHEVSTRICAGCACC